MSAGGAKLEIAAPFIPWVFQAYLGTDAGANKHRNLSSKWRGVPLTMNSDAGFAYNLVFFALHIIFILIDPETCITTMEL